MHHPGISCRGNEDGLRFRSTFRVDALHRLREACRIKTNPREVRHAPRRGQ